MECFCLGLCLTVCGRSYKWPPIVAFRFHSAWYIYTFQQWGALLCLSVLALGSIVNLVTWNAEAGGLVWTREVRHRGWDILSQTSEMPCRQPFIRLRKKKTKLLSPPTSLNDWVRQITADQGGPLSLFPTRLSLLLYRLSLSRSLTGFIGEETEHRKAQCGKPLVIWESWESRRRQRLHSAQ